MWIGSPKKEANSLTVTHKSVSQASNSERFNFALEISDIDATTAQQIDTFARAFVNLTTDTYDDTYIITAKNLETIAGGGN